jgi:predicted O-methyltransferase YrrM
VIRLIEEVIEDDRIYYDFGALERLRNQMELDKSTLNVKDLGAGSRVNQKKERSISSIVRTAVSPRWQCEQLFRLVNYLQPRNRLEIGTSLGLSSLYQYLPIREASFHSLEGCPEIAEIARQNFRKLRAEHIMLHIGDFAETLEQSLEELGEADYIFIDGNHRFESTVKYFETCLKYSHSGTVIVLDDIHWSGEMEAAWEAIKRHSSVKLSIDLFYMGLVFLEGAESTEAHYRIIKSKYKPSFRSLRF